MTTEHTTAHELGRPQHRVWSEIEPTPLGDFGGRIMIKALTADKAQVLHVAIAADTVIPDPADPSEREVHPMERIDVILTGRMAHGYACDGTSAQARRRSVRSGTR